MIQAEEKGSHPGRRVEKSRENREVTQGSMEAVSKGGFIKSVTTVGDQRLSCWGGSTLYTLI